MLGSGPRHRARARTKFAAGCPSQWVSNKRCGKPISGRVTRVITMDVVKPGNSAATCAQFNPRARRSAFKAAYRARVSNRRTRPDRVSGKSVSGRVGEPARKLSAVRPSQASACSTTALVAERLAVMPRRVAGSIGMEVVPSKGRLVSPPGRPNSALWLVTPRRVPRASPACRSGAGESGLWRGFTGRVLRHRPVALRLENNISSLCNGPDGYL